MRLFAVSLLGRPLIQFEWGLDEPSEPQPDNTAAELGFGFQQSVREPPLPSLSLDDPTED